MDVPPETTATPSAADTPENGPTPIPVANDTSCGLLRSVSEYTATAPGGRASSAKRNPSAAATSSTLPSPGGGAMTLRRWPDSADTTAKPLSPSVTYATVSTTTTLPA